MVSYWVVNCHVQLHLQKPRISVHRFILFFVNHLYLKKITIRKMCFNAGINSAIGERSDASCNSRAEQISKCFLTLSCM